MILSGKLPAAIYIQKNALDFYINGNVKHLDFPADIVSNSDIISPNQYEKLLVDFIAPEIVRKQKVILVLSEDIIFQKSIPLIEVKILDENMADFVNMIPIESQQLVKRGVKVDDNVQLFAVNKQLFEKIIEVLEKASFEVLALVPLSLYSTDGDFSEDLIKKIYQNKQFLKNTNFLSQSFLDGNSTQDKKTFIIIGFLLTIITILGSLLVVMYFKLPLPYSNLQKNIKISENTSATTNAESISPQPATESAALSKEQLEITILNGTGIAGQATKVKDLLIELGFLKVSTDNATGAKAEDTVIVFSPRVVDSLRQEIMDNLKEIFISISAQTNSATSSADILITTGKPKNQLE